MDVIAPSWRLDEMRAGGLRGQAAKATALAQAQI